MVKGQWETQASGTGGDMLRQQRETQAPAQAGQTLPQPLLWPLSLHTSLSTGSAGGSQMWGNSVPHRPPRHAWGIMK